MASIRRRAGLTVACALTLAVAACGSTRQESHSHDSASAAPVSSNSPTSAGTCLQQTITWRDSSGLADTQALAVALGKDSIAMFKAEADARRGNIAASAALIGSASAHSLAAAQATQANPPPACVKGLSANVEAAVVSLIDAGKSQQDAVTAITSGDIQTATTDLKASSSEIDASLKPFSAATRDFTKLGSDG